MSFLQQFLDKKKICIQKRAVRHPRHRKQPENSRNSRYFISGGKTAFFPGRNCRNQRQYPQRYPSGVHCRRPVHFSH